MPSWSTRPACTSSYSVETVHLARRVPAQGQLVAVNRVTSSGLKGHMTRLVCLMSFLVACGPIYKTPHPQTAVVAVGVGGTSLPEGVARGGAKVCAAGDTCSFDCEQGNCAFICEAGATCNLECDGGNCMTQCEQGATCNHDCDGGGCRSLCDGGATCNLECDGGSCQQACEAGASCNRECDGGNCDS